MSSNKKTITKLKHICRKNLFFLKMDKLSLISAGLFATADIFAVSLIVCALFKVQIKTMQLIETKNINLIVI